MDSLNVSTPNYKVVFKFCFLSWLRKYDQIIAQDMTDTVHHVIFLVKITLAEFENDFVISNVAYSVGNSLLNEPRWFQ